MTPSRTLLRSVELEGIGVHSGKAVRLSLLPSSAEGIIFRRVDLDGAEMPLAPDRIESLNSTSLRGDQFQVRTVEHVLSAVWIHGIDRLVVALDADEVPILDGSALPFVRAIEAAGIDTLPFVRPGLRVVRPFRVEEGDAFVSFEPPDGDRDLVVSYSIVYDHPAIGSRSLTLSLDRETFVRDIAPARTFGFLKDVDALRARGLALGASFENTVVLDERGVVGGALRFPDEFVRHKLLDLAGDLALLGRPLRGRVSAHKAGHRLHALAVRRLLEDPGLAEPE